MFKIGRATELSQEVLEIRLESRKESKAYTALWIVGWRTMKWISMETEGLQSPQLSPSAQEEVHRESLGKDVCQSHRQCGVKHSRRKQET